MFRRWRISVKSLLKPGNNGSAIAEGDSLLVYAVSDLLRKQQGKLTLTVYSLGGKTVNSLTKTVSIPANTSTLILEQPLVELLKGRQREDVVVSMELTASSGVSYQANCFLCLLKDLRLMPVKPEMSVEAAEDGCLITLKADKFVRALALSMYGDLFRPPAHMQSQRPHQRGRAA